MEHLIIADQTHTDTFHEITQDNISQEFWGDALYTKEKGIALFVLASDCVPIIFYDTNLQVVWAIHAGRAGLEKNIIQKTFSEISEKYGSQVSDFRVFVWPHICQCCYEVWELEVENFREKYNTCVLQNAENPKKYLLDIWAIALKQIEELWVPDSQIEYSELCTYEEKELFHSYRRKTHTGDENYGNNGFWIWLK